jgi:hypothetical protein
MQRRSTGRTITAALTAAGIRGTAVQGSGYVYFVGPDFDMLYTSMVCVRWMSDLTVDEWVREARELIETQKAAS